MAKKAKSHTHGSDREGAEEKQEEMCCDGSGKTAAEHRAESGDGKCCIDE